MAYMNHSLTAAPAAEATTPAPVDTDAFERLTIPHLADVARFARSLMRDDALADDLVQETYLHALRGWHTFRAGSNARSWLLAVCHHAFVRMLRREARYVEAPDDDPELESIATARAHWHAQQSGLMRVVERMELATAIDVALADLPPPYRVAIVLVDVQGYSYEEAAEITGVALGTVRSRLFRGRRLLQAALFTHAQDAGLAVPASPNVAAGMARARPQLTSAKDT